MASYDTMEAIQVTAKAYLRTIFNEVIMTSTKSMRTQIEKHKRTFLL
jgi:hypothetical protein